MKKPIVKSTIHLMDKKPNHIVEIDTYVMVKILEKLRDVVKTCIHEYFHYYLITSQTKNNLYQRQLYEYGYENHPQEILCNSLSKTLSKVYLNK